MDEKIIHRKADQGIVLCTISRPKALNALNSAFFKEFNDMLNELEANSRTQRALVITGEGKAFVAGADIAEMQHMDEKEAQSFSKTGQLAFARLQSLPVPVIAAVNGYALGGGCELAMACDIRLAGQKAVFGMPEVKLGLIPGYGGTQRLPRIVGQSYALHMLLSGNTIDAEEALRTGLVQKVLPDEELLSESLRLATHIASQGPDAVKTVKHLVHAGMNKPLTEAITMENESFPRLFGTDGPEGIKAFLEKRKPNWSSKK